LKFIGHPIGSRSRTGKKIQSKKRQINAMIKNEDKNAQKRQKNSKEKSKPGQ